MAIKVELRTKPISGNRQSLYLDFYPPIPHPETGEPTRREFLNLFLVNEIEHETADYLGNERYVFNIKGNRYRFVVLVTFIAGIMQVRFCGTHADYDKIKDIKNI